MKKAFIGAIVIILLGAACYVGWWFAADRGMISGKPNSPRAENFKTSLDGYLAKAVRNWSPPCIQMTASYGNERFSFKDVRFDHTPIGYRNSPDANNDANGSMKARLAYLENQGFFEVKPNQAGGTDYLLTWKGFAATNGNGCFFIAGAEREARIIGFEKKRIENGVDIYEITARLTAKNVASWASSPELKNLFPQFTSIERQLNPDPVVYELARNESGFTVIKERGQEPQFLRDENIAMVVKLAGSVTVERVKAAAESYLVKTGDSMGNSGLCLPLPSVPEVDQVSAAPASPQGYPLTASAPYIFDLYNLPGRNEYENQAKMRSYVLLRRLESLGLAKSETLNYSEFRGMPALGGMRYEINKDVAEKIRGNPRRCLPLGTLQVAEVIQFAQFNEGTRQPRFVVRMSLKPVDDEAKRIIGEFGHFARVAEVGTHMSGSLKYEDGEIRIASAQIYIPTFQPDISETRLPAILTGLSKPPGEAVSTGLGAVRTVPPSADGVIARAPSGVVSSIPAGVALHSVSVYEGTLPPGVRHSHMYHPEGTVRVSVLPSKAPIVLFLSAYEPINWIVQAAPSTQIARVVTSGYHPQRVTVVGTPGVSVTNVPYVGQQDQSATAVLRIFGTRPLSTQYEYTGKAFVIVGR